MAEYKDLVRRRKELEKLLDRIAPPESMDLQQMLKGVGGDKLRDEKRRLYQKNQDAIAAAETRQQKILEQIGTLDEQIAAADPEQQRSRFTRTATALGTGAVVGTGLTALQESRLRRQGQSKLDDSGALEQRIRSINPDAPDAREQYKASHSTARRKRFYNPRRGLGTLAPGVAMAATGALGRFGIAPNVDEQSSREALTDLGQATMTAGMGQVVGQYGLNKTAGDTVSGSSLQAFEEARERAKRPPNALAAAGPQSTPPNALAAGGPPSGPSSGPAGPQSTPPAAPPQQSPVPQNRDTLVDAARAAGAKGKLTKAEAAKYLKKNVTAQNRAEVARVLRVKSGPNFASRIGKKIGSLAATTKTLPSIAGPIVAGVVGYDMASSDAEARDMGPVEQTTRGLGGAGAGVAAYEGGRRLMNNPLVQRTLGRVLPPVAAYDMTRGAMEEGMHAWQGGAEDPAASGPLSNLLSQYDKAQVPDRNPLTQARENPDEFDRALSEFLDFATQMQASP
jgi:hypothetical protein